MQTSTTGRQILQDRPKVTVSRLLRRCHAEHFSGACMGHSAQYSMEAESPDAMQNASVAHAWDMPPGTFGHAYAQFMGSRNFQADDRPPVRFLEDPELAFVAARAREVHDFWHVLFGCHTNVFGELALKAMEFVQVSCQPRQMQLWGMHLGAVLSVGHG